MTDDLEDTDEAVVLTVDETLDVLPPYAAVLTLHCPYSGAKSATLRHLPTVAGEQRQRLVTWAEQKVHSFCEQGYDGTWEWDAPDENLLMEFTKYVREEEL